MDDSTTRWPGGRKLTGLRNFLMIAAAIGAGVMLLLVILTVAYRFVAPPVSTLMLWRFVSGNSIDYRWMPLDKISRNLPAAVVASEDARFCTHHGVDWEALGEVVDAYTANPDEAPRGASTITMQAVKNLFLWPSRSYLRKALEIPLAHLADLVWSKRRVIEIYLNVVEWGPGIYGAEAAALAHFGKPAAALTRQEAALLAAVLPNPLERSAGEPGSLTRRLAARVRARMSGIGPYLDCIGS